MGDSFGDRMKLLEGIESNRILIPQLPIVARLDGRSFSKFTKGMARPFDERMSRLMVATTTYLVQETNARIGYTQSDEISLTWLYDGKESPFFGGRVQKLCSILSSMATMFFNRYIQFEFEDIYYSRLPIFDCRVWNVPNKTEGANVFLWREQDATKNSISMAAQHYYSHKELMNKNGSEMQEMLHQKGINWNDYPAFFKRGTYIQRFKTVRKFTCDEIDKLPARHAARTNPDLEVERTDYKRLDMPPFGRVKNRAGVIYDGESPITQELSLEVVN